MSALVQIAETGIFSEDLSRNLHREFVPFNEELTAEYFAEEINSGRLSVRDAYIRYWSYEEDADLWGLPKDREWRALLPAWRNILTQTAQLLDYSEFQELLESMTRDYFFAKADEIAGDYNPFWDDMFLAAQLNRAKNLSNTVIDFELVGIAQNIPYRPIDAHPLELISEIQDDKVARALIDWLPKLDQRYDSSLRALIGTKLVNGVGSPEQRSHIFNLYFKGEISYPFNPVGKFNSGYLQHIVDCDSFDLNTRSRALDALDIKDRRNRAFIKSKTKDTLPEIRSRAYSQLAMHPLAEEWELYGKALQDPRIAIYGVIGLERIKEPRTIPHICKTLKAGTVDFQVKWRVIEILARFGSTKGATRTLVDMLEDPIISIECMIGSSLSESISSALIASDVGYKEDLLIQKVRERSKGFYYAIKILTAIKSKKALRVLKSLLTHKNQAYQFEALKALGLISDYSMVKQQVEALLLDPKFKTSFYPITLIGACGDESTAPILVQIMLEREEHPHKRIHAASILKERGSYIDRKKIEALLFDKDDDVAFTGADLALDSNVILSADTLLRALKFHYEGDRIATVDKVLELCAKHGGHEIIGRLIKFYHFVNDIHLAADIIEKFGDESHPALLPLLEEIRFCRPNGDLIGRGISGFAKYCTRGQFIDRVKRVTRQTRIRNKAYMLYQLKSQYRNRIRPNGYRPPRLAAV